MQDKDLYFILITSVIAILVVIYIVYYNSSKTEQKPTTPPLPLPTPLPLPPIPILPKSLTFGDVSIQPENSKEKYDINGSIVYPGKWPFFTKLLTCNGCLISENLVLTISGNHSVGEPVYLGTFNKDFRNTTIQKRFIIEIIKDYMYLTSATILVLDSKINLTDYVIPILLPPKNVIVKSYSLSGIGYKQITNGVITTSSILIDYPIKLTNCGENSFQYCGLVDSNYCQEIASPIVYIEGNKCYLASMIESGPTCTGPMLYLNISSILNFLITTIKNYQ